MTFHYTDFFRVEKNFYERPVLFLYMSKCIYHFILYDFFILFLLDDIFVQNNQDENSPHVSGFYWYLSVSWNKFQGRGVKYLNLFFISSEAHYSNCFWFPKHIDNLWKLLQKKSQKKIMTFFFVILEQIGGLKAAFERQHFPALKMPCVAYHICKI